MKCVYRSSMIGATSALLLFSLFFLSANAQSTVFPPIWMEEGAFVEFSFEEGIWYPSNEPPGVVYKSGTFRWSCIELVGTVARLNLTISYNIEGEVKHLSGAALVDVINRSVYDLDGTHVGSTQLWLKSNPNNGEQLVLWDLPPDAIFGAVETNRIGETCQGNQESYKVIGNGTINNKTAVFNLRCDMNTGLMIRGLMWNEAVFRAMNTGLMSPVIISDTNIDLGPSTDTFDFNSLFPIIIIAVAFVLVFVSIYWTRNKKRLSTGKK
ncbi:MAG: hypothetical protein ACOWW1_07260 [archaeon]